MRRCRERRLFGNRTCFQASFQFSDPRLKSFDQRAEFGDLLVQIGGILRPQCHAEGCQQDEERSMVEKMAGNLSHSVVPGRKCYSVRSSNYDTPRPLRFELLSSDATARSVSARTFAVRC